MGERVTPKMRHRVRTAYEADLIERLEAKADSVGFGEWIARDILREAAACIRDMVERREGLEEDLYQAVSVAYHRGATEWARRNYRQWTAWIEEGRVCLPPAPGAEA